MPKYCSLYVMMSGQEEAELISKTLVTEGLIACANIFDNVKSIYLWEGKLEEDHEVAVIMKTDKQVLTKCIERIKQLHSYDVPCICQWSIEAGNEEYLKWVSNSINS